MMRVALSRNISRTRALPLRGVGISLGKHVTHDVAAGTSVLCFWWCRRNRGGRIETFLHLQGERIKSFLHLRKKSMGAMMLGYYLQIAATQNSCIFRLKKKSWESNART
jgi:hypothetical protein